MDESGSKGQGIFASLRRLAETALGMLQNRLELFALELQEEKCSVLSILLWTAAAIFFGVLAITVITLTIVLLSPEGARLYVLIGLSLFYLILAVIMALGLKRQLKNRPPPFAESIAELKKDLDSLHSQKSR
jgi:uncharacterized membrane protein YqjE